MSYHAKMFKRNSDVEIKLGSNSPFAWKGDFLGKLTNTTIVYVLCPIILNISKNPKSRADHDIQGDAVLTEIGHNHIFTLKRDFSKKRLLLILSTSCTPITFLQCFKKNH